MWIKICANTSLEDAQLAVDAGANAIGFVFPRALGQVTRSQVREITPLLSKTIEKYGVFVDPSFDEVVAHRARVRPHRSATAHPPPIPGMALRLRGILRQFPLGDGLASCASCTMPPISTPSWKSFSTTTPLTQCDRFTNSQGRWRDGNRLRLARGGRRASCTALPICG